MSSNMKILLLDVETSPHLVWTFDLWKTNIRPDQIEEPSEMLTWAAKWYGEKKVIYRSYDAVDFLSLLWELMDEADVIVHYNGKRFDTPVINSALIVSGFQPPSPYKEVDLYKIVRSSFKFASNSLGYVAEKLLGKKKISTGGFGLWLSFLNNEEWAWAKMKEYNIADVLLTEELYTKLLGWIINHPNHGLFIEDQENPVCPNCGSENLIKKGFEYTKVMVYQRYKCKDCGKCPKGRQAVKGQAKTSKQVLA